MRIKILPADVKIGDTIIVDPLPDEIQENPYFTFEDRKITVEEITTLPDGGYYFIYGGDQRDSVYVAKNHNIEVSLTEILRKL